MSLRWWQVLLYQLCDGFNLISIFDTGEFIHAFGDFASALIALAVPGLCLLVSFLVEFFIELGDIGVEPVNTLHWILVLFFCLFEFLEKTFLFADGLFIILFHFYNLAFCLYQLFMFSEFFLPELIVVLCDFFEFFFQSLNQFFVLGDILVLLGIF